MELHQLRYFCAVARLGNFTRAAETEHVSQPSLSQQIRKLEEELGGRLFDRLGRRAALTPLGTAFRVHARAVLAELEEATARVRELAGTACGQVGVGTTATIGPYVLGEQLACFARSHPQIRVSVREESTSALLQRLREGSIDLALVALPVPGAGLACCRVLREPLLVALPERHPLAGREDVDLGELAGEPFLALREAQAGGDRRIAWSLRATVQPNVTFDSGHFCSVLALVAAGHGWSVVPRMAADTRQGCRFVPLRDRQAGRTVAAVHLRQRRLSLAQRLYLDHLVAFGVRAEAAFSPPGIARGT